MTERTEDEIRAEAEAIETKIVRHLAGGDYAGHDARLVLTALMATASRVAVGFAIPPELFFHTMTGAQIGYMKAIIAERRANREPAND